MENIIISDLEETVRLLVKYIGGKPIYFNNDYTSFDFTPSVDFPESNMVSYGEDAGYRLVDFTYPGELILDAGDTVTDLLDKITAVLGNYEYFYDLDGRFVFQEIKNYLNTGSPLDELSEEDYTKSYNNAKFMYSLTDLDTTTAITRNPNFDNIKNDFYVWGNITTTLSPVMFRFIRDNEQPWALLIKTQGDPFAAKRVIDETYARVTGLESESYLMDEALRETFDAQIRLAKIVVVFSAIAILISFLGLVAMSTYFIQQRSQEVAIRKVFGSSDRQILAKLTRSFLLYVGVAFVIAVPIIIYFARVWLSDYAYRIPLSPLIFLAAGLFCLLVSFAAVFFQSYRAATQNPVDTFRKRMN